MLRLVLLLFILIHCIASLPVNTTEQSFTSESNAYIKLLLLLIVVCVSFRQPVFRCRTIE